MKKEINLEFCSELATMISTQRTQTRCGEIVGELAGASSVNNLITLRNICIERKPISTLEIGLAYGASALVFAKSHQESSNPGKQHIAIDPYQLSVWREIGVFNVEKAGLADYVDVRTRMSCFELPKMLEAGEQFDLIYIDGSHLFENVFIDAYFCSRMLAINGIVTLDDCSDPNISKVIRFLNRNCPGLKEIDLRPFRADLGKTLRYRAARFLGRRQMRAFCRVGEPGQAYPGKLRSF